MFAVITLKFNLRGVFIKEMTKCADEMASIVDTGSTLFSKA